MEARSVDVIPDWPRVAVRAEMGWISLPSDARCRRRRRCIRSRARTQPLFPGSPWCGTELTRNSLAPDGEIVVPVGDRLSFDNLLHRIHPAASRVKKLAEQTPALFLAFDLLKKGRTELAARSLSMRRLQLEDFAARCFSGTNLFRLSPASPKVKDAECWLTSAGGGSDGVIAKRIDLPYQAGNREGMQK